MTARTCTVHDARSRRALVACLFFAGMLGSESAHAGGFDVPDNGAQALGRGAAFVAKADDATAMAYNPAGLARQRGTRLYVGGNLFLHSFEFQRAGSFPDDSKDNATPWGGRAFPRVQNVGRVSVVPFVAASTDFGSFDRFTLALGVFGPPTVGNRTFAPSQEGAPSASRYDLVQSRSTLLLPTAAAAYRVTRWLDVGLAAHLAVAKFAETRATYVDANDACKNAEYQPCDVSSSLAANATSLGATLGTLIRPLPSLAFGLSVRMPIRLEAEGTLTPSPPKIASVQVAPGSVAVTTELPLMIRAGGRYVAMDGDFELYDLELNGTFEGWGSAQGEGPRIRAASLGEFKDIDRRVVHGYSNTFSVRAGGGYNLEAAGGVFTLRAGSYFDSSATRFAYTRVDVDTLTKIAGTLGVGYRRGAVGIDVGYAAVASLPRGVGEGQGEIRPANDAKNGEPVDSRGRLMPSVNEGEYRGFTHVFALGMTLSFDALFGVSRRVHFRDRYEPAYVGPGS